MMIMPWPIIKTPRSLDQEHINSSFGSIITEYSCIKHKLNSGGNKANINVEVTIYPLHFSVNFYINLSLRLIAFV